MSKKRKKRLFLKCLGVLAFFVFPLAGAGFLVAGILLSWDSALPTVQWLSALFLAKIFFIASLVCFAALIFVAFIFFIAKATLSSGKTNRSIAPSRNRPVKLTQLQEQQQVQTLESTVEELKEKNEKETTKAQQEELQEELNEASDQTKKQIKTTLNKNVEHSKGELDKELDKLREVIEKLNRDQEKQREQMFPILQCQKIQQERLLVRKTILADPYLGPFYTTMLDKLVAVLVGMKALASGLVKREETTLEKGIMLAGSLIPLPGATAVGKLLSNVGGHVANRLLEKSMKSAVALVEDGIKQGVECVQKNAVNWVAGSVVGFLVSRDLSQVHQTSIYASTLKQIDDLAEQTTRRITEIYAESIKRLQKKNKAKPDIGAIKKLAECAVARLISYMRYYKTPIDASISSRAWTLVLSLGWYPSHQGLLPFTDKRIASFARLGAEKSGAFSQKFFQRVTWTDRGIFQCTGVRVIDKQGGCFYVKKGEQGNVKVYGYRGLTEKEFNDLVEACRQHKKLDSSDGIYTLTARLPLDIVTDPVKSAAPALCASEELPDFKKNPSLNVKEMNPLKEEVRLLKKEIKESKEERKQLDGNVRKLTEENRALREEMKNLFLMVKELKETSRNKPNSSVLTPSDQQKQLHKKMLKEIQGYCLSRGFFHEKSGDSAGIGLPKSGAQLFTKSSISPGKVSAPFPRYAEAAVLRRVVGCKA